MYLGVSVFQSLEQYEIKESGDLLNEKGQLQVKGWSRQPLLTYNPKGLSKFRRAYRLKEWNYYSVGTDRFYFAVAAIDLGYVTNYQTFFIDFTNDGKALMDEITASSLTKGLGLPKDSCHVGSHISYNSKNFSIHFDVGDCPDSSNNSSSSNLSDSQNNKNTLIHSIKITSNKMKLQADIKFNLSPNRESVCLATPIGKSNFYYNRKTNLIPVTGSLIIDGKEWLGPYQLQDAFGIMDWGRGIWDYNSFWLWGTCWGRTRDGRPIGLNLGEGFGDLSTHTENAINLDGVIHKLGHIEFHYNKEDLKQPWKFVCKHGRFGESPLEFTPLKIKYERNNFGLVMSSFHQIIGRIKGEVLLDSGERVEIDIFGRRRTTNIIFGDLNVFGGGSSGFGCDGCGCSGGF
ncbi:hypothetical protein PPL_01945 [Heterostelium album PN500]|uniref:Tocopherol cyclase n=1 Tax=Heterostelium pallidum (strain ATCC 26659 / Pp 5 / PN500) TaxID=670386 RepID=D3B0X8_HETP5|nr:hypothetical protein PPL_01945 [Heterostelium album PN500]EFA84952.1 hypothetical protein PPL_01945 [Heterostelium album PN500]|eukprot:XP_020437062.1 hypothetical protein PPL_01945 [Heterostelium album PN500]